ncbi:serine hydrolase, partial [Nocardia cyriacigeorgica]|uniref:serine hydrolase n=1 Tax=Nocardia cyriacigeorgica TaxID=135487 RepID=UPI003CC7C49D
MFTPSTASAEFVPRTPVAISAAGAIPGDNSIQRWGAGGGGGGGGARGPRGSNGGAQRPLMGALGQQIQQRQLTVVGEQLDLAHSDSRFGGDGAQHPDQPVGDPPHGLLIEQVTGRSFAEEMRRRILDPLGLSGTVVPQTSPEMPEPHPHAYYR